MKVKLATVVEGDPKVPFSVTTTPIPLIAPLYPLSVPYNVELLSTKASSTIFFIL